MKLWPPPTINLATLSRRERWLAIGGAAVVALVILDRVVVGPWWQHASRIRREIQGLEESIRSRRQLLNRKPLIVAEAEAYREHLQSQAAEGKTMASLLREIESLGQKSGIVLRQVRPLEGTTTDLYREYAVEVDYQGSIEQWIHFLYLLEASQSLLAVERATVSRLGPDSDLLEGAMRLMSRSMRHGEDPEAPAPS